jgi:hypothetical protein
VRLAGRVARVVGAGVEVEPPAVEQAPRSTTAKAAKAWHVARDLSGGWCMGEMAAQPASVLDRPMLARPAQHLLIAGGSGGHPKAAELLL